MPKPPILEIVDWQAVYDNGVDFARWLEGAENEKNRQTMEAIYAKQPLSEEVVGTLQSIARPIHVIAIAEDWCGDVVRHAPVLQKMADQNDAIHVRYITREGNEDVFIRFLTNGGEAIPKFIFLNDTFVECGNWGPMAQRFKDLIARGKACGDVAAARKIIYDAYFADKERSDMVPELLHHFEIAGANAVA